MYERSAASASSNSVPAKQLPGSINAKKLREVRSRRFSVRLMKWMISRTSQCVCVREQRRVDREHRVADRPRVLTTTVPITGSFTRSRSSASSSSRNARSGQN